MQLQNQFILCAVATFTAVHCSDTAFAESPPNIVFILADDMGVGDVSCLNPNSKIDTPAIDQIAKEGITFSDAHTASAVCTPTRYGLMTGRYCWRSELKERVLSGYSPCLIPAERMTVASLLKDQGYQTAMVGKWHLGISWSKKDGSVLTNMNPDTKVAEKEIDFGQPIQLGPTHLGFETFYGPAASWDMPPYGFIENDRLADTNLVQHSGGLVDDPADVQAARKRKASPEEIKEIAAKYPKASWRGGLKNPEMKATDAMPMITKRAVEVVKKMDKQKPFFLYIPLTAPHTPVTPNEQFAGKSRAGTYGDFVTEVDWSVGQIVAALKDQGLYDNTLVIFTADNGYSPKAFPDFQKEQTGHHPSHIYAGAKGKLYEGGHRVPFVASWPAVVPAGSQSDVMICLNDLMATCAELTGVDIPVNAGEDSFSFLSALRGDKKQVRETLVSHSFGGEFAIRKGEWKLLLSRHKLKRELFDLSSDVGEQNRLDKNQPLEVADLKATLTEIINNGRETPGPKQAYVQPTEWPQTDWMNE